MRRYHVYSTIAFLVANLWNFQLNRSVDLPVAEHAGWLQGVLARSWPSGCWARRSASLVLTLLMHPGSPIALSTSVFDDSTGFRTRLYWAQLIVIVAGHAAVVRAQQALDLNSVRGLHREERESARCGRPSSR